MAATRVRCFPANRYSGLRAVSCLGFRRFSVTKARMIASGTAMRRMACAC